MKFSIFFFSVILVSSLTAEAANEIRYVSIGDSYTIGTGVSPDQAWPVFLVSHLQAKGINVSLVANPSQNGWTTYHAIAKELPVYKTAKPDFATVMIGVNDWVQGVTAEQFRKNFGYLLDQMLVELPDKSRLIVVNIPDFSATPSGVQFGGGRDIQKGLSEFNTIISQEAAKRGLKVIDIYTVSQKMRQDPSLVAPDGLHPSAKGQLLFEEAVFPVAKAVLQASQ